MTASKLGPVAEKSVIKAQIDENLKKAYDAVLSEDVPDRFLTLLASLRDPTPPQPGADDAADDGADDDFRPVPARSAS